MLAHVARSICASAGRVAIPPLKKWSNIWSPPGKSDVYASVRERAGDFKISLHESGACNAGLTDQFAAKETDAIAAIGGRDIRARGRASPGAANWCLVRYQE